MSRPKMVTSQLQLEVRSSRRLQGNGARLTLPVLSFPLYCSGQI